MILRSAVLWMLLAVVAGIGLYLLKHEVRSLERELAATQRQIHADKIEIHVLKAEWSHLNDPERLRALADRHLGLAPMTSRQVVTADSLEAPHGELAEMPVPRHKPGGAP